MQRYSAHVLVVDDDADQREIMSRLLQAEGWTVSEAADGSEALRLIADEQPDLVMLDVSMPDQDGFTVCERLLQAQSGSSLPHVIFVTGRSELQNSLRGLEIGALDYVTKPFVPEDLLARARVAVRLKAQMDALAADAARDPLTGLWNRRQLVARGREMIAVAKRHEMGLSCIMIDLDHFKAVNDRFGHVAGDAVLQAVAERMRRALRESDLLFRYGGEEFLVFAAQTDASSAIQLAERLRAGIGARPVPIPKTGDVTELAVTVSLGVAHWTPGETVANLLRRADEALYRSKNTGRNKTTSWRSDMAGRAIQQRAME